MDVTLITAVFHTLGWVWKVVLSCKSFKGFAPWLGYFFNTLGSEYRSCMNSVSKITPGVDFINCFSPYSNLFCPTPNFYARKNFSKVGRRVRIVRCIEQTSLWNWTLVLQMFGFWMAICSKRPDSVPVFRCDTNISGIQM